ncbi:MAG: hypothetical protein L0Y71_22890 [Gemmataceae bacterium]|nr:hypothetical protein [Gemmataceae bacterium]
MVIPGRVQNGVVVLEGPVSLPEGAEVMVSVASAPSGVQGKRVVFPLVESDHPGTWDLTNERIAEILDEEDVSS